MAHMEATGGVSAARWVFRTRRLPSLHQGSRSNGQSPQICWDMFLTGPEKSLCLCPASGGKPLGTPKVIWELPLIFPRLLGAHIPSPGHVKAAGIWLLCPLGHPAPCPGHGWALSARIQPCGWKNPPGAEQTVGARAMFNPCPSLHCAAGHRDLGTPARPLRRHLFLLHPPNSAAAAGEELGTRSEASQDTRASIAGAMAAQPGGGEKPFHIVSPVLESLPLSQAAGTKVYMKLENVQPTGSFKIRGIGHLCQEVWDEANRRALELAQTEGWVSIHPFDHPLVWQGHASLVRELKDSLETKPDAILLAVGGGGLLAGVVAGLRQVGWQDVPIVAAETRGAHSFHAALAAGQLISLPDITSVAKCLGAKMVAARALECAQECQVISQVVEDAEAVRAVEQFLDDERMLVQPACGATLALLYTGRLQRLQREGWLRTPLASVVVVVCGGSSIQVAQLRALKSQLGLE
ncbi:serine dehydratase-like isoform 2-T2 [Spheniscus humboldti]